MFHQTFKLFFRCKIKQEANVFRRAVHDGINKNPDGKSVTELFFNRKIQKLLKKISVADPAEVLRLRKLGKLDAPTFEFMTDQQLEQSRKKMYERVNYYMQIPPVLDPKKDEVVTLSEDPFLEGYDMDHAKMIFTDISFNLKEQERIIVVREPNGVLRTANTDERHRMCEVYFPREGRNLDAPKMFEEEYLKSLLDREEYIFILDSACAQFEPDDPKYQEIVFRTYEKINKMGHFKRLHSTRHFGALAFYLVLNDKIDNMILDNILSSRIEDAISLVHLYHLIHPDCKSIKSSGDNEIDVLKAFIEKDSKKCGELNLALKSYLDLESNKKDADQGVHEAHGV